MKRSDSEQRRQYIRDLYASGKETCNTIAAKLGLTRQWIAFVVKDIPKHYGANESKAQAAAKRLELEARRADTQKIKDEIIQLYEAGYTQEDIALKVGKSQTWISAVIREAGAVRPKQPKRHPLMDQIVALRSEGLTLEDIGERVHLNHKQVGELLRKKNGERA